MKTVASTYKYVALSLTSFAAVLAVLLLCKPRQFRGHYIVPDAVFCIALLAVAVAMQRYKRSIAGEEQ